MIYSQSERNAKMKLLFITNVLGSSMLNDVFENESEFETIENAEEPLPLPSTFDEDEDADYSMQGEVGGHEESPLPMPSTAPQKGERW
jgi:hypothetical protein